MSKLDDIKEAFLEAEQRLLQDFQTEEPGEKGNAWESLEFIYE